MVQGAVLLGLAAVLVLPVLAVVRLPELARRRVLRILVVALLVRLAATLALHLTGAWHLTGRGAVTPDEATVDLAARLLAAGDERSPVVLGGSLHTSWLLISSAVYDVLWNSLLAMKLLNALLGTVLVVPVYFLARRLRPGAERLAAWLVALFPAAVVWSSLALREALIALLLTTLVLLAVTRPQTWAGRTAWVLGVAGALVVLAFTRSYMVPLLMCLLLGSALLRRTGRGVGVLSAVAACVLALGVVLLLPSGSETARVTVDLVAQPAGNVYNPLSDCEEVADCPAEADPRSAGGTAASLPGAALRPGSPRGSGPDSDLTSSLQSVAQKGVVRAFAIAVLAGRPVWETREFFLLLQPGVLVWWTLLPTAAAGVGVLARARAWDALSATAVYCAAVVVFLALTGQFIRHHYMLEPVGLVLAAVGVMALPGLPTWQRRVVVGSSAGMALAGAGSVLASLVGS